MQHIPPLEVLSRVLRAKVCPLCIERPEGSSTWGPTRQRPCETDCNVFINLEKLREIAASIYDPNIGPYEKAVLEHICQECPYSPTAGDFCADRTTRQCPLARQLNLVIQTIESIPANVN